MFTASCDKEKLEMKYTDRVTCDEADDSLNTYSVKIKSILDTSCAIAGCHSAASHKAGRDFSNYTSAVDDFDGIALATINHKWGLPYMPRKADKLSDAIIHDLTCWVKNGYPQ